MATSLEVRSPLLDHNVVEFAWSLPTHVKVSAGRGKWLLRQVLQRYVPQTLYERPKQGFNVPINAWLKGPLRDWAEHLLDARRIASEGFFDAPRVQAWWREHLGGRRDRFRELWAILIIEAWLEVQSDRRSIRERASRHPAAAVADAPHGSARLVQGL
jgi:asparagine synthase (glutamine-hydrolysing)